MLRLIFFLCALACATLALARPQQISPETAKRAVPDAICYSSKDCTGDPTRLFRKGKQSYLKTLGKCVSLLSGHTGVVYSGSNCKGKHQDVKHAECYNADSSWGCYYIAPNDA